jgi:hypothetical protein
MNTTHRIQRTTVTLILGLSIGVFAFTAPALASPVSEQQQGEQVLSEVNAGKLKGTSLTSAQYERVGQYLMGRALGSAQTYRAMDSLMDNMMGQATSDHMYQYLGVRYLGKNAQPNSHSMPFYGWMANMMGAYRGSSPYAGMILLVALPSPCPDYEVVKVGDPRRQLLAARVPSASDATISPAGDGPLDRWRLRQKVICWHAQQSSERRRIHDRHWRLAGERTSPVARRHIQRQTQRCV